MLFKRKIFSNREIMNKPITKDIHGIIDYSYAAIVPLLPELIGFKKQHAAKSICRALGAGALSYTLVTDARWAPIHWLPFKTHLVIDVSVSLIALATPWLLGFNQHSAARNTVVAIGLAGLAASLFTEPVERPEVMNDPLFL
jgi:hypothetical protein